MLPLAKAKDAYDDLLVKTAQAKLLVHALQGRKVSLTEDALGEYLPVKNNKLSIALNLQKLIVEINKDLMYLKNYNISSFKEYSGLKKATDDLNKDLVQINKHALVHRKISYIKTEVFSPQGLRKKMLNKMKDILANKKV